MKINLLTTLLALWISATLPLFAQLPVPPEGVARVPFTLHNTLGYHRMFLVEGPGIKYGFTMNRREHVPCNWPVGSKLYFTQDGETPTGYILTLSAADAGKTLRTDAAGPAPKEISGNATLPGAARPGITILLRNNTLRSQRIILIAYVPGEEGTRTAIFTLGKLGLWKEAFPAGTRLYRADQPTANATMRGQQPNQPPLLTVQRSDGGRIINLFE